VGVGVGPKLAENDILMSNNDTETQWAPTPPHVGLSAVTENTRPVDVTVKRFRHPCRNGGTEFIVILSANLARRNGEKFWR
jgi:hypothetical protein